MARADDPANQALWHHYQNDAVESFANAHSRLASLIAVAAKHHPAKSLNVMNVGIGEGWLEGQCHAKGWRVSALDPDGDATSSLKGKGIDARVGAITRIPFDPNSFDVVFCSEVLEHLRDDEVAAAVKELNRCLLTGGHLIGTVPYRENLRDTSVFCPHCKQTFHRWGHYQSFDEARMRTLMEGAGFQIEALRPRAFADFSRPGIRNKIKSIARAILGRMGEPIAMPSLFFVCRKTS
jgi:SAM-dependent methyltransferase